MAEQQNTIYAQIEESLQEIVNPSMLNKNTKKGLGIPPMSRPKSLSRSEEREDKSKDLYQQALKNFAEQLADTKRDIEETTLKQKDKEKLDETIDIPPETYIAKTYSLSDVERQNKNAIQKFKNNLNLYGIENKVKAQKKLDELKKQEVKDDLTSFGIEEPANVNTESATEFAEELLQKKQSNLEDVTKTIEENFSIEGFVDYMAIFEGVKGGDDILNIATLPYGITEQSTINYKIRRNSDENKNLTDREFAIKFYTAADKELQRQYSKVDFNKFTANQRMSILSTFSNTNFKGMGNYKDALREGNADEMSVQLLDAISAGTVGPKKTVNGLAIRRASEYNLFNPNRKIEFVEVVSQKGNYNLPVTYNYLDKDKNLINSFAPKQRLISKKSIPKDGSPVVLYSVSERKRIY